jgi:hypothetical protein
MMPKDPKDGLALIFGKHDPEEDGAGDDGYDMAGDGDDDGLLAACHEVTAALGITLDEAKAKAFCEALKSFVQMVDEEPHKEGGEAEEPMPDLGGEEEK